MERREFLQTSCTGLAALTAGGCSSLSGGKQPNILVVLTDDHAMQAMSAYGSFRNTTPNMDRIANEGMRFDHCLAVNALCGPSRAAIYTGKYGHVSGFRRNHLRLDESQVTFPQLLQQAGYQTALSGKWHMSKNDAKNRPMGFDYWNILPGQGKYFNPHMFEMGVDKQYEGYVTDIVTEQSLDFIQNRDKERPFFVMTCHKAPHSPWEFDEKHANIFDGKDIPEPETLWDDYATRSQAMQSAERSPLATLAKSMSRKTWATGPLDTGGSDDPKVVKKAVYQKFLKDYLRSVQAIDTNIGKMLDYLDEEGIADETIVMYVSDQGFFLGEHGFHNKRFFYEEAIKMPLAVRYPGKIKAGSANNDMLLNIDIAETLLDLAGVEVPAEMQGRSFKPQLMGETPADWRTSMFYRYYEESGVPMHYGVRNRRYKLIYFTGTGEWELYDLQEDKNELNNVYASENYAGVVRDMKAELDRLCVEYKVKNTDLNDYVPMEVPD
jgi:arylsulfatase A-like enzyme